MSNSLTDLRRQFHRIPELGFEESRTADLVCRTLDEIGVPYERGIGGTGIVATLTLGSGTGCIGLRADMDALPIEETSDVDWRSRYPGRMHACGHDGHMTMLLGAARELTRQAGFDGTVRFIFQPAEEHGKGAVAMMKDGLFDRFPADAVYGLHNMPSRPAGQIAMRRGPIMAAEDNFAVRITGRGGHSAMPHLGQDALTIGAALVTGLQTIVSRSIDPVDGAVVSATEFLTDGAVNVIPTNVTIKGDCRSFRPDISSLIEARIRTLADGICAAHGATSTITYDRVFPPTINSAAETAISEAAARTVSAVEADCPPVMASEDFGAMLLEKPGCYALIGNRGPDGKGGTALHNAAYDFNDDILPTGVAYWVALARAALPA
ncbi:M20 aminoacylase family protein [Pelagovum pacificum]|uniref:Amidohydrolase n=1 Tax=Pelagovum pacificum TaxID=2588711 RepID=A0A5C5GB27_9RHOB|nr:M20 aminoacylase family protein [Pelagovum pacificum]QQA42171.1 amidohydrolase [Pelagovum pacificum]TNY31257.1 amidohydrolase [Pelagovum pacificum]